MTRPTDISIDLETLGNRSDAAILSIGAAALNRDTGKIGPTMYQIIDLDDALRHGTVRGDTLKWWMQQSAQAKAVFTATNRVSLYEGLRALNDFVRALPADVCVWGNGSSFDISILEHAYDRVADRGTPGFKEEWKFWSVRDLRTAVDLADVSKTDVPFTGVAHNAIDDAVHQAKVLAYCFSKIRRAKKAADPAVEETEDW